jgi:regulator of protease activity HflC (stomatin/prohibitin superfamily)
VEIAVLLFIIAVIFISRSIKVVPQQNAWVVERLGKFHATLTPGLNFLVPFVDKVAYKHSLKEIPLDVPSQICITRDNTQLQVDGILYFQVTDPMRASYGSSNYIVAVTQLAQTSLRSVIGKLELDKTFEERDIINAQVVQAIDEAAPELGRQGVALRDQRPDAAERNPARDAGADHRRAGEARADCRLRRTPPGTDQYRHWRARSLHCALRG